MGDIIVQMSQQRNLESLQSTLATRIGLNQHYRLSIIFPAFNEIMTVKETLRAVWEQALPGIDKELIIVESNSTDGTRKAVQEFARQAGPQVKLILQDRPRGKGAAVREGLATATGDIILIQDADMEYDTKDYPGLLLPIIEGRADFVLGSRHMAAETWRIRRFEQRSFRALVLNLGGMFFHGLFNLVYGVRLTDPTTMYKVFRRSCLDTLSFKCNRFDFDLELVAKLIRAGHKPLEVPVTYQSRSFEQGKKIRFFHDPLTWLWAIARFRFTRLN